MRRRPPKLTRSTTRRLALAGFVAGGVLAVLVNTGTAGPGDAGGDVDETLEIEGPVELGRVDWIRNYDEGVAVAEETGKPMLLLFQEVPG